MNLFLLLASFLPLILCQFDLAISNILTPFPISRDTICAFQFNFSMFTAVFNFFFNTSHAGLFWCQGRIKERLNPTACTGRWETRWQIKESQNHSTPIFFLPFLSRRTIWKLDGVKTSMVPGREAQLVVQCLTVWTSFKPLASQITLPNSARVGRCWWRMTSTRFVEP